MSVLAHRIADEDVCAVEPADRPNFWNLVLYCEDGERIVVTAEHEREKGNLEDRALEIASAVKSWVAGALR